MADNNCFGSGLLPGNQSAAHLNTTATNTNPRGSGQSSQHQPRPSGGHTARFSSNHASAGGNATMMVMGSALTDADFPAIPSWDLAAVFKAKCLEAGTEWLPSQKTALRHAWNELAFLYGQQCKYCGGFGHVKRVCPTKRKLSILGK